MLETPDGSDAGPDVGRSYRSRREQWQAEYVRNLRVSDVVVLGAAFATADGIRFGLFGSARELAWSALSGIDYSVVGVVLAGLWLTLLAVVGSRSRRILGHGTEEYRRVVSSALVLFSLVAFLSLVFNIDPANGYIAIALPVGLLGLLANRGMWRSYAARQRVKGRYQTSLLVVGRESAAIDIANKFVLDARLGYEVVGLCTPTAPSVDATLVGSRHVPFVGTDRAVLDAVQASGADTVALSPTDHLNPLAIRRLIWDLEAFGIDLIVAAGLMDVAAERIRSQPVAGMAMLLIDEPQYDQANAWGKRVFDVAFAATALLCAAPLLAIAFVLIKVTSRGPAFYVAERVGMGGNVFGMLKFRSMVVGADAQLPGMLAAAGHDGLYFKVKDDPRVTRVGRILRKFSIDELPQFLNVLAGDMSVVGPRPQSPEEVTTYDDLVRRRLLVRPGLTGLWQVSGRSDVPAEDATRFDLSYVENWSMAQDLVIIGRTVAVVLRGRGAY
ncbi:sugar transferase [Mycolicibacterium arabiense]|uniref:sugar transferase n=1 Tax=Mycolicibacterium arabiense TaxID=1286181 RepID=UPI001F3C6F66|nr:sugar transferase [Mycolicibacterium arabiense]